MGYEQTPPRVTGPSASRKRTSLSRRHRYPLNPRRKAALPSEASAYQNRWARPGFMNCVFRFRKCRGRSGFDEMIDEKKLEERLVALEAAKSWSPRVVSRLETLLRSGTDEALYRINPIQFATEKSIAEAEAVDLFLHGCVAGLFDMDWLLVCPMCSDVVESFRSLHTHFHCHLCQ